MTLKRMTLLQEMLAFIGLGGRLHLAWISSAEAQRFVEVVTDFTEQIRRLGPNPLRGFTQPDMVLRPRAVASYDLESETGRPKKNRSSSSAAAKP
jgi:F420-non-reducing hydrogenase iron-sulfur subunit